LQGGGKKKEKKVKNPLDNNDEKGVYLMQGNRSAYLKRYLILTPCRYWKHRKGPYLI
jgi:hypothetical protein